jgi:hypothetical protein
VRKLDTTVTAARTNSHRTRWSFRCLTKSHTAHEFVLAGVLHVPESERDARPRKFFTSASKNGKNPLFIHLAIRGSIAM